MSGTGAGVSISYDYPRSRGKRRVPVVRPDMTAASNPPSGGAFHGRVPASVPSPAGAWVEPSIRVVLIEDDPDQRRYAREELTSHRELEVVGTFVSGEDALGQLARVRPDVVLVDIGLPGLSGIDVVARCKPDMPGVQFMMLTVIEDVAKVYAALAAGATGYLLKKDIPGRLFEAIRELWGGGSPMSASIARQVVLAFRPRSASSGDSRVQEASSSLTDREQEILDLLAAGRLYKEIADHLGIGLGTVNTHIRRIYEKLHVHNRSEAIASTRRR